MAKVSFRVEYDSKEIAEFFRKMRKYFPQLRAQSLGFVGYEVKKILVSKYLSGNEFKFKGFKDVKGRRKVGYSIDKYARYVRITSYPLNLYERGRMLRSGRKEAGHYIITRKLKQDAQSSINQFAQQFDAKYMQRYINENF